MTRKLKDQPLAALERCFQALRDKVHRIPESCQEELKTAFQEVDQAIAAMRATREAELNLWGGAPGDPQAQQDPGHADTILQHVFSAIPDLLTIHDPNYHIIMSNWHWPGLTPAVERGGPLKCYEVYLHHNQPCEHCQLQAVMATGRPQRIVRYNPVDHRIREIHAFPIRDETGQVVLVAEHVRDITENHLADKALKESEERFRAIFETAQDAIFIKDLSFRYTQVNPAMERLLGQPADRIIGLTEKDLFGEDTAHIRKQDQKVLKGEVIKRVVTLPVQGVPTTFHVVKVPLYDDTGQVVGLCGIARDITEVKQAEEALRESEERFRSLFEYAPDAYSLMDLAGNFLNCNRAAEEMTGYSRQELIGKNYQALPLLDERQNLLVAELLTRYVYGEVLGPIDFTLIRKDGEKVIVEAKGLPLKSQGESLLLVISRDITARKRAEEALRQSENRFRDITENAAEWVWEVDAQGKYTFSSPVVEQLLGYKPEEVLGKYFYDFFLPDQREELKDAALAVFATQKSFRDFLNPNLHKNGQIVWLSTGGVPILDSRGNLQGYRGADTDVTPRREAEELSQNLITKSPVGIYLIQNGKFKQINQLILAITGYGKDDFGELTPLEFVHPEDREATRENAVKMLKGLSSVPYEFRITTKDGKTKWIMETMASIQYQGKRAALGYCMDITERKQLEAQLLQAQKMEAVGRLAGGVAHDFNNLLMAITGYGELMRSNVVEGDPLYDCLENILRAGRQAAALTQQLLTFSRRQIVRPQELDLKQVVWDLEPMLRRLIGEDIDLEIFTEPEPAAVKADPGHLSQIIMNLVVNARDAMPRGGPPHPEHHPGQH